MQAVDKTDGEEVCIEPVSGKVPAVEQVARDKMIDPDFETDEFQEAEETLEMAGEQP